jgi:enoyl-CoA hydratase/carnithine racemase
MKKMKAADRQANQRDALGLGSLFHRVSSLAKPVVACVNGPALGGGAGLVAASDIVVAEEGAFFAFSEVRLGLVPAVISPFCLRRLGPALTRRLFLSAERFNATQAKAWGFVDEVASGQEALDAAVRAGLEPLEEQCAAALGFLLIGRRLPAQAVASLDRAVALARRHGGKRGLYVALCNRGLARGLAGHADGGLEDLREAASSAAAGGWYRVLGTVYRAVVELLAGHSEACLDAVGSGRLDLQDIEHPDGAGLGDALDRIDALASGANPEPIRAWVDAWTGSAEVEGVVYGIELASGARSRLAE